MRHVGVVAVLVLTGCSLNMQLCALRSAGDYTATPILDASGDLPQAKLAMESVAQQALDFLDTGEVASLTRGELKARLLAIVPLKFHGVLRGALEAVSGRHLEVNRIGARNVLRIRAYLEGILTGCTEYLDEYHPGNG